MQLNSPLDKMARKPRPREGRFVRISGSGAFTAFVLTACLTLGSVIALRAESAEAVSNDSCQSLLEQARGAAGTGNSGAAGSIYGRIISSPLCPADIKSEALESLGAEKEKRGELQKAINDYERALSFQPGSKRIRGSLGRIHAGRGDIRERLGDINGAISDYAYSLGYTPEDLTIRDELCRLLLERGHARKKRGDIQSAMEDYRLAVQYNPRLKEAKDALAGIVEDTKRIGRDGVLNF